MEEENIDDDYKMKIDKEKTIEELEKIKNENKVSNRDNDEQSKINVEEKFSNKEKNSKSNYNSNINDDNYEDINNNIIMNDSFKKINHEYKKIAINKLHSITNDIKKLQNINKNEENHKNILYLLEKGNNQFNFNNRINNGKLNKNENIKELMTKEGVIENINDITIEKEYSTENLEKNKKEKNNDEDIDIDLNINENIERNYNDENDNELINYKNDSFSENKENEDENLGKKENILGREISNELIKKIIKNKDDDKNEEIELYSYEGNENNNKISENEEYFINQNIINYQNNKNINDKTNKIDDNQKNEINNNNENKINLVKDKIDINIIKADRFIITNNNIKENKIHQNIIDDDKITKNKNFINKNDKEISDKKDCLKKQEALIKKNELNNINKIVSNKKSIKEKDEIENPIMKEQKIIKREIYKKNMKKIPYPKFQIDNSIKADNKNNLELKLSNNKRDALFEKYKTINNHEKNNKSNSKKIFDLSINTDSISDFNNIKNKLEKYHRTTYIPYNNYISFYQRSSSKNKNMKNNLSKAEGNHSLIDKYHLNNNDFSYDGIIYQKRSVKTHDFSMATTSRLYLKKEKKRGNTFGKYEAKNIKIELNDNREKKEKININQKQLYTPINYSKKIPLSGQNKVKNNNYINNINYIYNNNNFNFEKDKGDYLYQKEKNRNSYLINQKQNNNFENIINNKYNKMDLSSDNMYQNEYYFNKSNNFNTSNIKKDINDFINQNRNKEIYNTMKNFQINNRANQFNESIKFIRSNNNFNNRIFKNYSYYYLIANNNEEQNKEYKNYEKYHYLDNINRNININIEDLLILEEKLNELIYFLKSIKDTKNQCLDFWNYLLNSSLNKLEKIFKNEKIIKIIKLSFNLLLLSIMICYEFSFDKKMMNRTYILLLEILEINYNNLISICQNILYLNQQEHSTNIWIQLLNKIVDDSINEKEKYYFPNFQFYEKMNLNNDKLIKKLKDILSNYQTEFSSLIYSLFKKIFQKNYEDINDFFKEYIIRKEIDFNNQNIPTNQIRPPFILSKRKKKFTLILSIDETLVHLQQINNNQCSLKLRPHLIEFLENMKPYYELILFTSKSKFYTDPIISIIQRNKIYFDFIFYREHCIIIGNDYVKDLTRIGRPLDSTIIIDNIPQHFKLQKENGIIIKSFWAQDPSDKALYYLIPILINIALEETDTRDGLEKYKDDITGKITSNIYKLYLSQS